MRDPCVFNVQNAGGGVRPSILISFIMFESSIIHYKGTQVEISKFILVDEWWAFITININADPEETQQYAASHRLQASHLWDE